MIYRSFLGTDRRTSPLDTQKQMEKPESTDFGNNTQRHVSSPSDENVSEVNNSISGMRLLARFRRYTLVTEVCKAQLTVRGVEKSSIALLQSSTQYV